MKQNKIYYIILISISVLIGCTGKNELIGKKLYILGGDVKESKKIKYLTEVELYFENDKEVYLTTLVRYGKKMKDIDTAVKKYKYTYVDKTLSIPEYGFENQKLFESNKLYNNNLEIFLYKSSFLSLSANDKRDRLKEIYGTGWKNVLKLLSTEEINRNIVSEIGLKQNPESSTNKIVSRQNEQTETQTDDSLDICHL